MGTTAANMATFNDNTATGGNAYFYQVVAMGSAVVPASAPSTSVSVTIAVPMAPTALGVAAPAYNQVNLTWTDNSTNEAGFVIQRALSNSGAPVAFSQIAVKPDGMGGAQTYSDTTTQASTSYWYQVFAYNSLGTSGLAGPMMVTTPAQPVTPPAGGGGGGGGGGGSTISASGPAMVTGGSVPVTTTAGGNVIYSVGIQSQNSEFALVIPSGIQAMVNGQPVTAVTASALDKSAIPPAPTNSAALLAYDFGPRGATFSAPGIALTMTYDPAALPAGAQEQQLQLAWWDGTAWQMLASQVDTVGHKISAQVTHFTNFAVLATVPAPTPTPMPYSYSYTDAHSCAYAHAYAYSNADAYTYADTDTCANTDANADAYTDADSCGTTDWA